MSDQELPKPGEPDPLEGQLLDHVNQGRADGGIDVAAWAGGIEEVPAHLPAFRVGRRWISFAKLITGIIALGILGVIICRFFWGFEFMQEFVAKYPGTSSDYVKPMDGGFPWWLRWQHLFNLLFMMFIIRAGIQILADHPRLYVNPGSTPDTEWMRLRGAVPADRRDMAQPARVWKAKDDAVALPKWLGIPGIRHSIGLARWWHFSFDTLWVINGVIFYILIFSTGQYARIVPNSLDVFPNAFSTFFTYMSLHLPENAGYSTYNALQLLAYFTTVFIAAPLALITGLLQAPSISGRLGLAAGPLNRQTARTIHFAVLIWMIFFIFVHTAMVFMTGLIPNLNHIIYGTNTSRSSVLFIYLAFMAGIVVLWLLASPFTLRYPRVVQKVGRFMVGNTKAFMEWADPRDTYREDQISPYFWPNGEEPRSTVYERHIANDFADWSVRIDGLVANPVALSLADLKAMPKQEQITQHFCIQGWSGIGKWGGVHMQHILELVQPNPEAKWVVFYSMADGAVGGRYYDCHRIENMSHHLTILAYEFNGEPLNITHGAPLRLRDEVELGFKQVKWIEAIEFVESFDHLGAGQGGYNEDQEFYGYRMPI